LSSQPLEEEPAGHVLIVDDDAAIARGWTRILRLNGWRVAHAASLHQARTTIRRRPHIRVALVDVGLPDGTGLALLDDLNELRPRPAIVIVTSAPDAGLSADTLGRVDAVVPKPLSGRLLLDIAQKVTRERTIAHAAAFAAAHDFSARETEILELACCGADDEACARHLDCGLATIKTYWKRIYAKSGHRGQRALLFALWRDAWDRARGSIAPPGR
jgi:DNA-binding NarL/FixJ family response regulator